MLLLITDDAADGANWAIDNFSLEIFEKEKQRFFPTPLRLPAPRSETFSVY